MFNTLHLRKYFIALNFHPHSTLAKKIDGFKKRFDPKYKQRSFPHMALLRPFEVSNLDIGQLVEELKEELETFFFDNSDQKLTFSGVGVLQNKKYQVVYYNPILGEDIKHCQDLIFDICKGFIPKSLGYKMNSRQFLPLGYFDEKDCLKPVIEQAQLEFSHGEQEMWIEGISLYEKVNKSWVCLESLIEFKHDHNMFLKLEV